MNSFVEAAPTDQDCADSVAPVICLPATALDAGAAQNNLGFMYAHGHGVEQDYVEALKWYGLAAEQGYEPAQVNLGVMYANGQGVPQDYSQTLHWYPVSYTHLTLPTKRIV